MRGAMRLIPGILLGSLLLGLTGCEQKTPADMIIGKWTRLSRNKPVDPPEILEFTADGDFIRTAGGEQQIFSYRLTNDNTVLEIEEQFGQKNYYKIDILNRDKLVFKTASSR